MRRAPRDTLEMMARFSVLTRLKEHENSNLYSKMRVYDGESLKGHRSQCANGSGVSRTPPV